MTPRTGLVLVRQAGSAAALMPALQGLLDSGPTAKIIIIAFPQAVATCREVADDLGKFSFHAVQTESEAHEIFEKEIGGAAFLPHRDFFCCGGGCILLGGRKTEGRRIGSLPGSR